MIEITSPQLNQSAVCEPILRSLPEWFGIESSLVECVQDIETLPTLLAKSESQVVGFLAIKQHNRFAAEIHVMGIYPQFDCAV